MARDVLRLSMSVYFEEKRQVPMPSKQRKADILVDLPISVAAKVLLLNEMLEQNVSPSELARRLGTTRQEINRLIDLEHSTKIDRISEALAALERQLDVVVA